MPYPFLSAWFTFVFGCFSNSLTTLMEVKVKYISDKKTKTKTKNKTKTKTKTPAQTQ